MRFLLVILVAAVACDDSDVTPLDLSGGTPFCSATFGATGCPTGLLCCSYSCAPRSGDAGLCDGPNICEYPVGGKCPATPF